MNQPQKHYDQLKKPNAKDHRFYYSIYMKCPEMKILEIENRLVVASG
jgi:hypothetical protein